MSQTSYAIDHPEAFAGLIADARVTEKESYAAEGAIDFGMGVVNGNNDEKQVRKPVFNKSVLSQSTDLVTSNSTIVTVNGRALTAVVFATDDATTMAAIAAEIATDEDVLSATYPGSGDDITILSVDGAELDVSAVTTGGAGQPTWTQAQSNTGAFYGLAVHKHREALTVGGNDAAYQNEETVSVMRKGVLWVPTTGAVNNKAAAYMIVGGADAGKFTETSTNNIKAGIFRNTNAAAGIAKVEVVLPAALP